MAALEFLAGAPFDLMYDMVKVALGNTKLFRSQLRKLENILKKLQPQILEHIRLNNVQLHLSTVHIDELRQKIKDGLMLLEKLGSISNFNVHVWGSCLMPGYADQLEELIIELEDLLEIVKLEHLPLLGRVTLSAESTEGKVDEVSSNLKLLTLSAASTKGKVDEVSCDLKLLRDTVADLKERVHGIQLEGISPPVERAGSWHSATDEYTADMNFIESVEQFADEFTNYFA